MAGCKTLPDVCTTLWQIAGPMILNGVFKFLIDFVVVAFVGHISNVELTAISIVNGMVEGFGFGLLVFCMKELTFVTGDLGDGRADACSCGSSATAAAASKPSAGLA